MVFASSLLLAIAGFATPIATLQSGDSLALRAIRFYSADQNQTRVRAFVQVPYAWLTPSAPGERGVVAYTVTIALTDAAGVTVQRDSWRSRAPIAARQRGAHAVEVLEFIVTPGTYRFAAEVQDSVSGARAMSAIDVRGYSRNPGMSDLLLSPDMRVASHEDTVPRPGELRRGDVLITTVARLRLTPFKSKAYYLLEAYTAPQAEKAGAMYVAIADSAGKMLVRTAPAAIRVPAGGGMLRGQLDLQGLPPGRFTMKVVVELGGQRFERSCDFTMAGPEEQPSPEEPLADAMSVRAEESEGDWEYFTKMTGPQLDAAAAPLHYLAGRSELRGYGKKLRVPGKRYFLVRFWLQRDTSSASSRNEVREGFYDAIAFANRTYGERGPSGPVPGWKTDRGRVYAKYGAPDDIFRRQRRGAAPAYEVWRYTRNGSGWCIFADRSGAGNYALVRSNYREEAGIRSWRGVLTEEAVVDIERFLKVDL